MKFVFIISLPRSGSTLLQRLLMGHSAISSCGEPWLALPIAMLDRQKEAFATYGHFSSACAISNLIENMDGGRAVFQEEAGRFIERVYRHVNTENSQYFLDKTPRYYKIMEDLKVMFPEAKFLFLTRPPLDVFGSILNYVNGSTFRLPTWRQDIFEGMPKLAHSLRNLDSSIDCHVQYESLVVDPVAELNRIFAFLGLEMEHGIVENLAERDVNMGDPHGAKKYQQVSRDSLGGWRKSIDSSTKKRVALSWLGKVPASDFSAFGSDKEDQLKQLQEHSVGVNLGDRLGWLAGKTYFYNNINVFRWSLQRRRESRHPSVY